MRMTTGQEQSLKSGESTGVLKKKFIDFYTF